MKKNIFDKFQDKLSEKIELFEKREDKEILKKSMFWIIFFFPYGLYLLLFKTKIKRFVKLIVLMLFSFMIILSFDIVKNPNRVYNEVARQSYNEFAVENKKLNLEECLYVSKHNHFKINDEMYFSFKIYDKLNMYYGIFKVKNYNKDYELVSLYDVDYNFSNIYSNKDFKRVKDIHPIIVDFILSTNQNIGLEDISKATEVKEIDRFENLITQDISIENKTYTFEFNDFDVLKIIESDKNKNLYTFDMHNSLMLNISESCKKLLKKNFDLNYKLVGYNYINNEHYYSVVVGDKLYSIIHNPGHTIDLIRVPDKEELFNRLNTY